jgi:hypothetical protein
MKKLYQILQNREYLFITVLGILPLLGKNVIINLFKEKRITRILYLKIHQHLFRLIL